MRTPKSLVDARAELYAGLNEGVTCPCCDRFAKMYKRRITSSMAYGLILIFRWYRARGFTRDWLHIEDYFKSIPDLPSSIRGDVSKLRHWGLLEKKVGEQDDGNPSLGLYRLTVRGRDFVLGVVDVEEYVLLYDDLPHGFEGDLVSIRECLRKRFNYGELLRAS